VTPGQFEEHVSYLKDIKAILVTVVVLLSGIGVILSALCVWLTLKF
jgi:hypothetical protein